MVNFVAKQSEMLLYLNNVRTTHDMPLAGGESAAGRGAVRQRDNGPLADLEDDLGSDLNNSGFCRTRNHSGVGKVNRLAWLPEVLVIE
jgi:hypothetical protein